MDFTEILHNLEISVLERKEKHAISLIEAFNQDEIDSGEEIQQGISRLCLYRP